MIRSDEQFSFQITTERTRMEGGSCLAILEGSTSDGYGHYSGRKGMLYDTVVSSVKSKG